MKSLITLNLNGMVEDKKREAFYKVLADAGWGKVQGALLDTVWTITTWGTSATKPGADAAIRLDVDNACKGSGIPKARVKVMWAHDETIKSL